MRVRARKFGEPAGASEMTDPGPPKGQRRGRRPAPSPAVRRAIAPAEHGLRIIDTPMAFWLVQRFLDDPDFRAAMPLAPLRISRYDWIIFPPPIPISWPPGEPARLVRLPPLRVDSRYGLRPPRAKHGRPRKRDPAVGDQLFFDGLMVSVQAMIDSGQRLGVVMRGLANHLTSEPRLRPRIEMQLYRAWARWRKLRQAEAGPRPLSPSAPPLHDFSRR
jgi:hypothetical protein